jgi:hypothetical protein
MREPTTATVAVTMTENAIETRAETVKGRVLRLLVARVDATNAVTTLKIWEVDGTAGSRAAKTRGMNIGREIRGTERETIPLTDNTRAD